jgi:exosortase
LLSESLRAEEVNTSTIEEQGPAPIPAGRLNWLGWLQISVLAVLVVLLYRRILFTWIEQLWTDPYYSHCFFVPLFSAWVVWRTRDKFRKLPLHPNWWGMIVSLSGAGMLLLGVFGAEEFLSRVSLLILLAGVVIQFCGWRYFRTALFPWAALFLMIPLPRILFAEITLPLQFLSSRLGSGLLDLAGIQNLREGNLIHLHSLTLDVAEACSGLRSLMSLVTVAVIYGYVFSSKLWVRLALVIGAIPIAIVANGFRIMGTGVVGEYWGRDKSEGFFHGFSGVVVFVFSFLLLIFLGQAVQWTFGSIRRRAAT